MGWAFPVEGRPLLVSGLGGGLGRAILGGGEARALGASMAKMNKNDKAKAPLSADKQGLLVKSKSAGQTPLQRYTDLIVSVSAFVVLMVAIMLLNLSASNQLQINSNLVGSTAKMKEMIQSVTKDLFNLKLSYGEDPQTPNIRSSLERLRENTAQMDEYLKVMQEGGTVVDNIVHLRIAPLDNANVRKHIQESQRSWNEYNALIQEYLKTASDIRADSTALDIAVNQAQSSALIIYNHLDKLTTDIYYSSITQGKSLRRAQVGGIVLALLYLGLFLFWFVRRLINSDKEAMSARQETNEIMSTVNEGLFLFDRDYVISNQYSAELEKIIGQKKLGGKSLLEVLGEFVSDKDLKVTQQFIRQLFKRKIKANLINDLNPVSKIKVQVDDFGGYKVTKWLSFKFRRVLTGGEISRILVSVEDITNAVLLEERLQQEHDQNDRQIEMLTTILNTDSMLMRSFINTVRTCIAKINGVLKDQSRSERELREKTKDMYREIHNLKGEASALHLRNFVSIATAFEEKLKQLQAQEELTGNDFLPLAVQLDELVSLATTIENLATRIGALDGSMFKQGGSGAGERRGGEVMRRFFESFTEEAAKRNNKEAKIKVVGFDEAGVSEADLNALREICIQMIRNSVVHGVESPAERLAKGKPREGQIFLNLEKKNGGYVMTYQDDGKGLDFDKIRQTLVSRGLATPDQAQAMGTSELARSIFQSGFSTAPKPNEDGGRGVGMDVIKDRIKTLRGNLKIATGEGKYLKFTVILPASRA